MSNQVTDPQKVTVYGRLSYAHIFVARKNQKQPQNPPKFSTDVIIDPSTPEGKQSLAAIRAAVKPACLAQWGKWPYGKLFDENMKAHDSKRFCLYDGNTIRDDDGNIRPETKNMWVLKCSSKEDMPPVVVDSDGRTPITAKDKKCYPGSYGKVGVRIYGTDAGGSPGVFAALNAVMFKKHGDPLGGGGAARPEDYFEAEDPGLSDDEV